MFQKKFVPLSFMCFNTGLHLAVAANVAPKSLPCTDKWVPSTATMWELNAPITMCCPSGFYLIEYDISKFHSGFMCVKST